MSNSKMESDNLTVRDYIAIKAIQGIIRRWDGHPFGGGLDSPHYKELAEESYLIADAMIKEGKQMKAPTPKPKGLKRPDCPPMPPAPRIPLKKYHDRLGLFDVQHEKTTLYVLSVALSYSYDTGIDFFEVVGVYSSKQKAINKAKKDYKELAYNVEEVILDE